MRQLCALVAGFLVAMPPAMTQEVDHSTMDHSAMDHDSMDHGDMDHSTMDHDSGSATSEPAVVTPVPPLTDADRAAAHGSHTGHEHFDSDVHYYLLFDKLEYRRGDGEDSLGWQAKGWLGTDLDRLWLRSEGARMNGAFESADAELLYGRSVSTWWDVVGGVRHDFRPGDDRTWAALGVQGLAPQRFEIAATAYARSGGHTAARFEAEYQLLFTNRLVLQPTVDLWAHGKDDAAHGVAAGLSTIEAGLRLRYEFTRRFAPYVGFELERALGETASWRRGAGTNVSEQRVVAGLRTWF